MSQSSPTIGANKSGLVYRQEDNDGKQALLNHHKGPSAPSYAEAGAIWLDDAATPWLLKAHDGTDWIVLAAMNASTNTATPYLGAAPLPLVGYASDTGSANAYALAPAPALSAYVAGQIVVFKPANANTGASTIAISGLSAASIKMPDGSALPSGILQTSGLYLLVHNGTDFTLLNPVGSAAAKNTGTSGSTVPLLDGANTWSGLQTLSGGAVIAGRDYTGAVTIADDAAASFSPPATGGLMMFFVPGNSTNYFGGVFYYCSAGVGAMTQVLGGSLFATNATDGTLTGTTGTDGQVTVRAKSGTALIYIENRSGSSKTFYYKHLG